MAKTQRTYLQEPQLEQYGMDGWERHQEYITTCIKCDTTFLSNANGEALCNGETYQDCPYCTK